MKVENVLHGFDKIFVNEYNTSKQRSSRLIKGHMDFDKSI